MDYDEQLVFLGRFIIGTCELMCPVKERTVRERERLLHPLERLEQSSENGKEHRSQTTRHRNKPNHFKADPSKTVKVFSRSAAGMKMPAPSDLRPFPVLKSTVSYLIDKIACSEIETLGWIDRYNFVTDRLRAVRQDMVIQGLPPEQCIQLLEPMVKFHVFAGYWLCENPIQLYDPKINALFLQECIKRLLVMYDATRESKRKLVPRNFSQDLSSIPLVLESCNSTEHMMEALYLVINLGDPQALNRSLSRSGDSPGTCSTCVEYTAFKISLALWRGEYVMVCRYIRQLDPLLCMAAALHLPSIRRQALMVMTTAYSSKILKFPISVLQNYLLWNNHKEVSSECQYYGIMVEELKDTESCVQFLKGSFNSDVKLISTSRLHWMDKILTTSAVIKVLLSS